MIGSASIISPMVEGMVSRNMSRMARASSARNAVIWPATTSRDRSGSVTVPSATPNRPSGSCINRKAMASQNIAPSPSVEANMELTSTLTWVVLAAITAGPISDKIANTPASRQ